MSSDSQEKIEVVVSISKKLYDELKQQLELLKASNIARFKDIKTVEDLVSEFLQSLKESKKEFDNMQEKMFSVFQDLDQKQKIIKDIFSSFAKEWDGFKPDTEEEEEDDEDFFDEMEDDEDDEDEEEENKKDKKKDKPDKDKKS